MNTLLYKNISLTLYSRKGDVFCVWKMSWRWGQTAILTQQYFFLILAGVAQPWVTESPKPSVCRWLSLWHLVPNWLELPVHLVILLFNAHLHLLFFRLFTQVHLLIDSSVKSQCITTRVALHIKRVNKYTRWPVNLFL